jgi:hypothetical protein
MKKTLSWSRTTVIALVILAELVFLAVSTAGFFSKTYTTTGLPPTLYRPDIRPPKQKNETKIESW